ncbi:MAG: hypothetical protein IJV65_01360 [Kiritimatiellae bacterium]|nr:hypothetical protein [Kiritimatiellia bacterium]
MARKPLSRRFAAAAIAAALLAAALLLAARWRASRLPAPDVPVLLWRNVAAEPADPATVATDAFVDQISDLWKGGFETPSARRLRQYASWGRPLPDAPVLLRLGSARADLVQKDGVEAILEGAGFQAFVDLPVEDVETGAPGLLSWDDVRAAAKRGTLRFAPCVSARTNATLSLEGACDLYRERVGRRADAVALRGGAAGSASADIDIAFSDRAPAAGWRGFRQPLFGCTPVLGGRHAFALELRQDATDPAFFGTLAVSHPSGENPPPGENFAIVLFRSGEEEPLAIVDMVAAGDGGEPRPLAPGETFETPVPAAPPFPLEVRVYDESLMVLYFRRTLFKADVKRDRAWRPPVLDPDERIEIDPL